MSTNMAEEHHRPENSRPVTAVLVLGDAAVLAEALLLRLTQRGVAGQYIPSAADSEIARAVRDPRWDAVAILTHDDVFALRLALLSAHIRPELPVWASLFDATLARELHVAVPGVHVISPSELVAETICRECIRVGARPGGTRGVRLVDDALRLLVGAGIGLLIALLVQVVASILALHDGVINALYFSTRSVATVADAPHVAAAPVWFKLVSTLDTVVALLLVAVFTAALVRRLSRPRLTTLLGARRAPRRGHILLVGFGQVGFRLAATLHARGIGVIAVEQDPAAPCVRLARAAGIPVAIARGDDRAALELAGLRRCAAVAAVTSSDLVNVEIGLAARDLAPGVPVVLRLGDGQVVTETDSLLHLGEVCDAHAIAADALVVMLIGDSGAID